MRKALVNQQQRIRWRYHMLIAAVLLLIICIDVAVIVCRMNHAGSIEANLSDIRQFKLQLDPNTASAEALAELPGLSIRQATAIVEFRTRHSDHSPDGRCYHSLADLDDVHGIGPKTLEKVRKYLHFPQGGGTAGCAKDVEDSQ